MIVRIEIDFPVAVDFDNEFQRRLDELLSDFCRRYEAANPDRVMWPFGHGSKMLVHPMMLSDDEPIPFDEGVYAVQVAERERYDTDPYHRGDYDWKEVTLAVVGYGGWGRKGDWWNR